jgi:hypothetical protein
MADVADDVEDLETVISAAVRLHDNGQSTDMSLIPVDRFNRGLGLSSTLIPSSSLMLVIGVFRCSAPESRGRAPTLRSPDWLGLSNSGRRCNR